ncbi:MAG: hypothetical protein CMJ90_12185 [Planctomycetes bacterium]|nr:hypothetical protein [Planctomycetota bacterium]
MTQNTLVETAPLTGRGRDVFVGRQPIYDRDLNLVAYELLFRNGDVAAADVVDGDLATFTVMLNALVEIGLPRLVGDKKAFVNLTRNSVLCEYATLFPKDQIVMEVLEDVTVDEELLDMIHKFSEAGYEIALDDFVFREELRPLIDIADMVKIDVQALDEQEVRRHVAEFGDLKLLAEKVETDEEFRFCRDLGFQFFQGWFLGKPKVITVKHIPTSQLSVLRLLAALHDDGASRDVLAEIIRQDPALTYRLVRSVNPGTHGGAIESVAHAVDLIGNERLEHWVTLLSLSGEEDTSGELMFRSLVRARFCERVAREVHPSQSARFYLCGQLSLIDEIVGAPRDELLEDVALDASMRGALLDGDGPAGLALQCAESKERGEPGTFPGISSARLDALWDEAAAWAVAVRCDVGF